VPFFGVGSRRVFGGASFALSNAGGLPLLRCRSRGVPGGDKRNTGHGDPVPVHHELGQGWSAAVSSQETVVNAFLQPRLYLQKQRGQCVKVFTTICFQHNHKQKEEVASAYLGTKASGLVQGELISASGEEGVHEIFRKILGEHRKLTNI
jgi:hypothetical protein